MFEVGRTYIRRQLHERYGGQAQGGISTPKAEPIVLIFTGAGGDQWGYRDGWEEDGTFRYSGEGRNGDMQFRAGNRAVRDHAANGKDLHVFEADGRGHAKYVGQMVCAGYDLVPDVPDGNGHPRTAIVFRLLPVEDVGGARPDATVPSSDQIQPPAWYWTSDLETVRQAALQSPQRTPEAKEARRRVHHRSEAVKVYVQRRANGTCEGCGLPAPFRTPSGRPYLEPHHTRRLSDGGPDHPAWVVAVCPTCHRRAHHAEDSESFNRKLVGTANRLEGL